MAKKKSAVKKTMDVVAKKAAAVTTAVVKEVKSLTKKKAASVGFDWPDATGPFAKVTEELDEVRVDPSEAEVGDLLFACVNVARHLGHDPEAALRLATSTFRDRFRQVEELAAERGVVLADAGIDALDQLWDEVKRRRP